MQNPFVNKDNKAPFLTVDNLRVGYQDVDVLAGISFSAYPGGKYWPLWGG